MDAPVGVCTVPCHVLPEGQGLCCPLSCSGHWVVAISGDPMPVAQPPWVPHVTSLPEVSPAHPKEQDPSPSSPPQGALPIAHLSWLSSTLGLRASSPRGPVTDHARNRGCLPAALPCMQAWRLLEPARAIKLGCPGQGHPPLQAGPLLRSPRTRTPCPQGLGPWAVKLCSACHTRSPLCSPPAGLCAACTPRPVPPLPGLL